MSRQRWGDRIAERVCALCGRTGMDVKPGLACWPDGSCMSMDRCSDRRGRCRDRAHALGVAWPTGMTDAAAAPIRGGR